MRSAPALLLLLAQPAAGQAAGPPLTLESAIDLARAGDPALEAAVAGVRAADAGRRGASLRPNPILALDVENVGASRAFDVVEAPKQTLALLYPLERGGKRTARVAAAEALAARAEIERAGAAAELTLAVTVAYTDALAAERRLVDAGERARVAAEGLRIARVRVAAGRASPLEESRAAVVLTNAEAASRREARLAAAARASLSLRIGPAAHGPLDGGWFDRVADAPAGEQGGRLAAASARADVAAAVAQERLAQAQRVPDLTVSAGLRRVPLVGSAAAVLGLSVPLPLFNGGRAAVDQASAERMRAEASARAAQLASTAAVTRAVAERDNAADAARVAVGPALRAAQEAARIARIGYREGKFAQLDLLDAERALADTRSAATEALAAFHGAQARLDRLTAPFDGDAG